MQRGKKYRDALKKYDVAKLHGVREASEIVTKLRTAKFDETVNLTVNLGIDPRQSEQQVRGIVPLPHGTGQSIKVCVIASGDKVQEALDAGADFAGGVDIVEKIQTQDWLDFDKMIATPDMMRHVGKLGKILGPRGLMPNPKVGTVTLNIGPTVKALKAGQVEYRNDKGGVVHVVAGKASFAPEKIYENLLVLLNAITKARPSTAKGVYLKKVMLNPTMGPGVKIDPNAIKNEVEEAKRARLLA